MFSSESATFIHLNQSQRFCCTSHRNIIHETRVLIGSLSALPYTAIPFLFFSFAKLLFQDGPGFKYTFMNGRLQSPRLGLNARLRMRPTPLKSVAGFKYTSTDACRSDASLKGIL
jgi:hypothetical protein